MSNLYWGRFGFIQSMRCCTSRWHYRIRMSKRRKRNENEIFSFIILINILSTGYCLNFFSRNEMSKQVFCLHSPIKMLALFNRYMDSFSLHYIDWLVKVIQIWETYLLTVLTYVGWLFAYIVCAKSNKYEVRQLTTKTTFFSRKKRSL